MKTKPIIMYDIVQGSDEWFAEKLGKPSASGISQLITTTGKSSKQREGYLYALVAERITGQRSEAFQSEAMAEGLEREQESREMYEIAKSVDVKQCGVVYKDKDKKFVCSPDGIVNGKYGLELKNVLPKTQVKYLLKGVLPTEYVIQVQASMYITGFKRWDFVSYSPGLKPLILSVQRDDFLIDLMEVELEVFCNEIEEVTKKVRG